MFDPLYTPETSGLGAFLSALSWVLSDPENLDRLTDRLRTKWETDPEHRVRFGTPDSVDDPARFSE